MYAFVSIRKSQALMLVPGSNWRNERYARNIASWTRSSASAGLHVILRAAAYRESRSGSASSAKRFLSSALRAACDSATEFPPRLRVEDARIKSEEKIRLAPVNGEG